MLKPDNQIEILRQLNFGLSKECQQEFLKTIIEKPVENRLHGDGEKLMMFQKNLNMIWFFAIRSYGQ